MMKINELANLIEKGVIETKMEFELFCSYAEYGNDGNVECLDLQINIFENLVYIDISGYMDISEICVKDIRNLETYLPFEIYNPDCISKKQIIEFMNSKYGNKYHVGNCYEEEIGSSSMGKLFIECNHIYVKLYENTIPGLRYKFMPSKCDYVILDYKEMGFIALNIEDEWIRVPFCYSQNANKFYLDTGNFVLHILLFERENGKLCAQHETELTPLESMNLKRALEFQKLSPISKEQYEFGIRLSERIFNQ